jgi:hypothetical protein
MQYFDLSKLWCIDSTLSDPKWCLREFYIILLTLGHLRWKTCVSGLNAIFRGTEVAKHPLYSIGPKMMFGSVSEHFANLRHVKRCKTCVSGLNALFRGTEVSKHPFYYIGPKMMFATVSEHFANLRHIKICNSCVTSLNALFRGIEVAIYPFYYGRPNMMFGSGLDHFANLWTWKDEKLVFRAWIHFFEVPKLWSIHSTPMDPKWCLGMF